MTRSPRRWGRTLVVVPMVAFLAAGATALAAPAVDNSGTVFVQTTPALSGVRLAIGGGLVTTGWDGSVSLHVSDLRGIAARVSLADSSLDATDTLAISKIQTAPHSAKRESHLGVGLDITSRVRLQVDAGNTGVPARSVHSVRLHSITGQVLTVDPQKTPYVTMLSRRTRLTSGTLTAQTVSWTVDSVQVGPGVSLTTQQPRFDPFRHQVWELRLHPVHGTVVVDTVPATAGVAFNLDGATLTTGADGRATGVVSDLNNVSDRLRLSTPVAGSLTVSLLQVAKRPPGARFQRHVLAALMIRRPVSLSFKDAVGAQVPVGRISELRLEGGGATVVLTGDEIAQPVSLVSGVARQVEAVWQPKEVTYAVADVRMDGGAAVFAGQQRFNPSTTANWRVSLSVFDLKVTVRDVIFGTRISSPAWVTRPDGQRYRIELAARQATVLPSLVRGDYDLEAESAIYGSHTKLLVSRNDEVDLRVVTGLDVVIFALTTVSLIASVLVLGRFVQRGRGRRPAKGQP
jgi:hypothetical protein